MEATPVGTEGAALKDWYYNKPPTNNVEQVYGLLQQILINLSESVLAIESEYPFMKAEFDRERAEYFEQYERRKAEDLSERLNVTSSHREKLVRDYALDTKWCSMRGSGPTSFSCSTGRQFDGVCFCARSG